MKAVETTFNCTAVPSDFVTVKPCVNVGDPDGRTTIKTTYAPLPGAEYVCLSSRDTMLLGRVLVSEAMNGNVTQGDLDWAEAVVAELTEKLPSPEPVQHPQGYAALTPQAKQIVSHMRRAGSISMREAMNDYGIAGGTLTRRITDIKKAGFSVSSEKRKHPMTGQSFTRYTLVE